MRVCVRVYLNHECNCICKYFRVHECIHICSFFIWADILFEYWMLMRAVVKSCLGMFFLFMLCVWIWIGTRESDRQTGNVSLWFPFRLFWHSAVFNPQHSHNINYSLHPRTLSGCACEDSANSSFVHLTFSTALTLLHPFFFMHS